MATIHVPIKALGNPETPSDSLKAKYTIKLGFRFRQVNLALIIRN